MRDPYPNTNSWITCLFIVSSLPAKKGKNCWPATTEHDKLLMVAQFVGKVGTYVKKHAQLLDG